MAPVRRPNSRVQAVGKIRGILGHHAPTEDDAQPATNIRENSDPLIKFVLRRSVAIMKKKAEFFKIFGPVIEGKGINLASFESGMEYSDIDVHANGIVLNGSVTVNPSVNMNENVTPRKKMKDLSFELVASKFSMPISEAAKELQIGETTLAIWCRRSGIPQWPYRKIRSMDILLTNMKEYGKDEHFSDIGVAGAMKNLEQEKEVIEKNPTLPLQENTLNLIKKMYNVSSYKKREKKKT